MDIKQCFKPGCKFEAEYVCKCASSWTYSCRQHTGKHIELSNKNHIFEFIFKDSCEGTKEAILGFLVKEKSEYINLKRKILASFSQHLLNLEEYIRELIKTLNSSSDVISNCCLKIEEAKNISDSMKDPILNLLRLQPSEAVEKVKMIIPTISDWYESRKSFCGFNKEIGNMIESFIKDEFEAHLDKRYVNIESIEEDENKDIILKNSELANAKASISLINESSQSFKILKNVKKPRKRKIENKKNLLNFQISSATYNLNSKLKESALIALDTLRNKTAEIWSRSNNPELEMDFRAICSAYQSCSNLYDPQLMQAYQYYLNAYQQKTSLYNLWKDKNKVIYFSIYNTEIENQVVKILKIPKSLDQFTCITQLPNGKLFCFCSNDYNSSGIIVLIDVNGGVKVLPSGHPWNSLSCIYFNNSVYCFGERHWLSCLMLSNRFDLDQNRWIQLVSMPKVDCYLYSIIFNGNILISGYENRNLLLYSIDIDSFSTIPYKFGSCKKILINAERLYLIEFGKKGSIYESEIGSYTNWTRIADSKIYFSPNQVYCSQNKSGIYIGTVCKYEDGNWVGRQRLMVYECYKFDLNTKLTSNLLSLRYITD